METPGSCDVAEDGDKCPRAVSTDLGLLQICNFPEHACALYVAIFGLHFPHVSIVTKNVF